MIQSGDKYHRNGKLYTVVTVSTLGLNEVIIQFKDNKNGVHSSSLLYFAQNYSKFIPGITIIKE